MIIDAHHHWAPESFFADIDKFILPGDTIERNGKWIEVHRDGFRLFAVVPEEFCSIESKLQAMDATGVDKAILNADGFIEFLTIDLCRNFNDQMAALVKQHPDRLVGLAHVPPEDERCVEELDRAIGTLGLKGVAIATHIWSKRLPLDAKELRPFYQKVNELDVPILIHPANLPLEYEMFRGYDLARTFGRRVSATLACARLLQSDLIEEFPKLRFVLPHFGGTFFATKDIIWGSFILHGGEPIDFESRLDHFYFDTAPPYWPKHAFNHALQTLGPQRILFGTDHPIIPTYINRAIAMAEGWQMDPGVRQAVMCENARRLWNI